MIRYTLCNSIFNSKVSTLERENISSLFISPQNLALIQNIQSLQSSEPGDLGLFHIGPRTSSKWPQKLSCKENKELRSFLLGLMKFKGTY